MWKESLLLIAITGCVAAQTGQVNEDDKAIDDAAGGSESPVNVPLNEETDAAMDALANFMGFTCPKGHRCLPVLDCLPCDYGTYKDNEGSDLCKRCPPDCTTLRKGAQSREECIPFCPPGYEISECGKTCTKCRPGTYKSTWEKTTVCTQCPAGSNPVADKIGMNNESQCYLEDESMPETSATTHLPPTVPTVTVTCQSASDCGFGGACYNGYCGCLTTSCSRLAYAAMPDCQHFCQCEITTKTWRLHSCNVQELFDEKIDNCNWDYNVEKSLCFSTIDCELDTCAPPASADMCSYGSRKFMTCLKNLHAKCSRIPVNELSAVSGDIDAELYRRLRDLLLPVTTVGGMESVYNDYMARCLDDHNASTTTEPGTSETTTARRPTIATIAETDDCPISCPLPPAEESNICSASVDQYFTCLDVCTTDAADNLLRDYVSLNADIKSQLMSMVNNGDPWMNIYAWYLNECADEQPTTSTPLTTQKSSTVETSSKTCQSAPDCGPAGDCYGGYCGCLTSNCSDLAYVAMPRCGYFCQCEITTQTWRLHSCNSYELFDERINNCNWNYSVEVDLCFSTVNCQMDTCPPPSSADKCSIDTRTYMTCLQSLYVQCTRHPIDELESTAHQIDTALYGELVNLVEPVETRADMESVYYSYMHRCLAGTGV